MLKAILAYHENHMKTRWYVVLAFAGWCLVSNCGYAQYATGAGKLLIGVRRYPVESPRSVPFAGKRTAYPQERQEDFWYKCKKSVLSSFINESIKQSLEDTLDTEIKSPPPDNICEILVPYEEHHRKNGLENSDFLDTANIIFDPLHSKANPTFITPFTAHKPINLNLQNPF